MKKDIDVFDIPLYEDGVRAIQKMNEGINVFQDKNLTPVPLFDNMEYVPYGDDNLRPDNIVSLTRNDEVLSPNTFFNILSTYGTGLKISTSTGEEITNPEIKDFFKFNRSPKYLLEQITDMKFFFWTVSVLILNTDGNKIVKLRHKEVTYTRFEKNDKKGKINHIFYTNWADGMPEKENIEVIELLDIYDPLGDLMVRMGKMAGDDGIQKMRTETRKFAMVNMIPVPGKKYYPFPYWWSIFNSGWYDIKQMIPEGKKAKFRNGIILKYQVEINAKYWEILFADERITDPQKQAERKQKEKENIKNFLTGMVNAGKVWFSGFYVDPTGKEQSMVRINVIDNTKQGGDWIDDTEEASNMECYAQGIHPSLIGATPGKTKGSFSGTDKRELFTIHQALEIPIHDVLLEPYFVIKEFNGWDLKCEIPMMLLTTLDQKTDAKEVNTENTIGNDN